MKEYRLRQDGFVEVKRRLRVLLCVFFPLVTIGGIAASNGRWDDPVTYCTLPIIAVIGFEVYRQALTKQRKAWDTFVIMLDEKRIVRKKEGYPDITLERHTLRSVETKKDGALMIVAGSQLLIVSRHLEGLDTLKVALEQKIHA